MISSPQTSTNGNGTPQPWLKETVQAFFEGFVWSGAPTRVAASQPGTTVETAEATMSMTVGRFFELFPWEGQPSIGVPIAPIEAHNPVEKPAVDDLTLDDFSSLFG